MTRTDLLALTPQTLASLANRGLVKRAEKDLAAGSGPEVTTAEDGTVHGVFPDGTGTVLPPVGGLDAATCTCAAPGVCRHRIGLVLAYRQTAGPAGEPFGGTAPATTGGSTAEPAGGTAAVSSGKPTGRAGAQSSGRAATKTNGAASGGTAGKGNGETTTETPEEAPGGAPDAPQVTWSPGEFDDNALTATLGRPALAAARRTAGRGFTARLHRPTAEDPVPRVELPTCTVRFPVPHELGYALTDASAALRGEVVALAVWAFRAGDEGDTTEVTVGGRTTPTAGADDALRAALALADELLLDGVRQAGPVFAGSLERAREALTAASWHWPAGAVADLREQLDAYAARGTRYEAERFASLLAELHARRRAAGHDPAGVLGTREAPRTPLRRVRLVALGCRIGGTTRDRTAETYFAHADAGIALVLRKRWELTEDQAPTGHELGGRRLLNSPLRALATANVVSENTSRAADRTVSVARGRIAATSVTPVGSSWTELPGSLLLHDTAAHLRTLGDRPPRLVRPRVAADAVRVVAVDAVESYGYDPAGQVLEATLRDAAGNDVLLRAEYNPLSPGGLDALATALEDGRVSHVSGMLTRAHGRTVLDPLALLTPTGVLVPDLSPGAGDTRLTTAPPRVTDPITAVLESALSALAEAAHQGLRHTAPTRLTQSATRLHSTGLHTAAGLLRTLVHTLTAQGAHAAVPAWATAQIHLTTTLELHQEGPTASDQLPLKS